MKVVVFPNAMDQIISTEQYVRSEGMHKVQEITKSRGLCCLVAKFIVAPIQQAAVQSYLHQEVVERRSLAIIMSLPVESPIA
jgi:hypothetical protein